MTTVKDQLLTWNLIDNSCYAYNEYELELGYLQYENVGRHMHWCWYQYNDIRMSPGCLQEVRDMQKELFKHIRVEKK